MDVNNQSIKCIVQFHLFYLASNIPVKLKNPNKTQKYPIKPNKTQKTRPGWGFFEKTRVFANPAYFGPCTSKSHHAGAVL
jgi:hypothetical protein